jgi:hypothetical protein
MDKGKKAKTEDIVDLETEDNNGKKDDAKYMTID